MAWLRKGDNAATHPFVMALYDVDPTDERLVNEALGFLQRCAEQSAGHLTDGVIDRGTAVLMGGPSRWESLVAACVQAGLLTRHGRGKRPAWKIAEDADFLHIRSRSELEYERRRKRDAANPDLVVPARLRDGDGCRYCGQVVLWRARRGLRRGTYHHREGRHTKTTTVEMFVVACHGCNLQLGDEGLAAEQMYPLLPPPSEPFYGADTVELLANNGVTVTPGIARPGSQPEPARGPADSSATPLGSRTVARPDTARPGSQPEPARGPADSSATPLGSRTVARPDTARPGSQPEPARGPADSSATPLGSRTVARPGSARRAAGDPARPGAPPGVPPDLQVSASSSRSEVYGPGRDGTGTGGVGSGEPPHQAVLPAAQTPRRRGRRGDSRG